MSLQSVAQKFKTEMVNPFTRTVVFIGAIALAIVPFALSIFGLSVSGGTEVSSLPWYIWAIATLLLLLAIVLGRYMFMLKNHGAEDISIRPKNQ